MPPKFRIYSDRRIARTLMQPGSGTRRQFAARGGRAGFLYRQSGRRLFKNQDRLYPFDEKRPETLSVLDKSAFSAKIRSDGRMDIEVRAPAAYWVERGNKPGPKDGKLMRIRVRRGAQRKRKGKYVIRGGGRVVRGKDGRFYLFTRKVRAHKGYGLLRRSIEAAFRQPRR